MYSWTKAFKIEKWRKKKKGKRNKKMTRNAAYLDINIIELSVLQTQNNLFKKVHLRWWEI